MHLSQNIKNNHIYSILSISNRKLKDLLLLLLMYYLRFRTLYVDGPMTECHCPLPGIRETRIWILISGCSHLLGGLLGDVQLPELLQVDGVDLLSAGIRAWWLQGLHAGLWHRWTTHLYWTVMPAQTRNRLTLTIIMHLYSDFVIQVYGYNTAIFLP